MGSDARASFAALRRAGHLTHIVDESHFVPTEWRTLAGRITRKLMRPVMINELRHRVSTVLRSMQPDAVFVFKGNYVTRDILGDVRAAGARSIMYYPDVSFHTHGKEIPLALPHYDHVFTAKTFGVADMTAHGVRSVSFLPPGFDPEIHRPMELVDTDRQRFECDVSFIGTWSPKKEELLTSLHAAVPDARMRIWGNQWEKRTGHALDDVVMGGEITGDDYARAICGSHICLGILSEQRKGASSGDLITARTFQIPACGGFMLHEYTDEAALYFAEDAEAGFFRSPEDLADKIRAYLSDDDRRRQIAGAGHRRSIESDYSIDARMSHVAAYVATARQ